MLSQHIYSRDVTIEVFPPTENVKKSRDHCLVIRFAVWGSRLCGWPLSRGKTITAMFSAPQKITIPRLRGYNTFTILLLINYRIIFHRSEILKTILKLKQKWTNEWKETWQPQATTRESYVPNMGRRGLPLAVRWPTLDLRSRRASHVIYKIALWQTSDLKVLENRIRWFLFLHLLSHRQCLIVLCILKYRNF